MFYEFGYLASRGYQCCYFQIWRLLMQRNFPFRNKQTYCLSLGRRIVVQSEWQITSSGSNFCFIPYSLTFLKHIYSLSYLKICANKAWLLVLRECLLLIPLEWFCGCALLLTLNCVIFDKTNSVEITLSQSLDRFRALVYHYLFMVNWMDSIIKRI